MTSRRIIVPVILIAAQLLSGAACRRTDATRETLLATNKVWTIMTVGNLDPPRMPFAMNVVWFTASREGREYGRGQLIEIGADDHGFKAQYPQSAWVSENALHLWYPADEPRPATPLVIKNEGAGDIRWLRVLGDEMFLILDLQSRKSVEVNMFRREEKPWVHVTGALVDGQSISADRRVTTEAFRLIELSVVDGKVALQTH